MDNRPQKPPPLRPQYIKEGSRHSVPMTVNMPEMMKGVTVQLHVKVRGMWRVRLGMWLVRLGVRIAGARSEISEE